MSTSNEEFEPTMKIAIYGGKRSDVKESIEPSLEATRLSPNDASFFIDLGSAYHQLGQTQQSMKALERAVQLDPDNQKARSFLAVTKFLLGDNKGAYEQYDWLRERNPELAAELARGFEELSEAQRIRRQTPKPKH